MPDTKNPVLLYAFPDLELPIVDANGDIQQGIYTTVFSDRSAFPDLAGFAKPFVQVMFEGTTAKTHFYLQRLSLGATATGTGSQAAYWMLLSGIRQRSPEPSNNKEGKGNDQKDKGKGKGKSNTSKNKDTFSILLPLTQSTGLSRPDPLLPLATALQRGTSVADQTRVPVTLSSFTPLSLHTGTYDADNAMLTLPAQGLTQQTIALLSTVFTSVSDPLDVMRMPRTSVYEIAKEKKEKDKNEGFVQREGFREGNTKKTCTINDSTTNDKPLNYSLENASFDAGNLMLVLGLLAVVMFFVSDGLLKFLASMFSAAGIQDDNRPLHFAHATLLLCLLFVIGSLMAFRQYSNMMMFIVIFMVYYNKVSVLFLKEINDQRNSIIIMFFRENFFSNWQDAKALPLYVHWISAIISLFLLGILYKQDSEKKDKDKDKGTDDAFNFADPLFISGMIFYMISIFALIFSIYWAVSS